MPWHRPHLLRSLLRSTVSVKAGTPWPTLLSRCIVSLHVGSICEPNNLRLSPGFLLQEDANTSIDPQESLCPEFKSSDAEPMADRVTPDAVATVVSRQKFAETALTIFNWAAQQNGYIHTPSSYAALIQKLCDAKMFASVWQVLDDMHANHTEIGTGIFETIIQGYVNAGQIKPAIDAFDKMAKFGCSPTIEMYSCVIAYVMKGKRHHVSVYLFKRLTKEGLSANVTVFSALIHGYCHVGQIHEAHQLIEEMKNSGLEPDEAIYNCLIESLSKASRYYSAQGLVREMRDKGLAPSIFAYNSLIEALSKDRRIVSAYRVFTDMKKTGALPNVDSYNIILEGFFRMNEVSRAIKIYKQMPKADCPPDIQTDKIMLAGFTKCGKLSRAMCFLDSIVACSRNLDVVGVNTVLHGLCLKRINKAEEFFQRMVDGMCVPDVVSYTTLMHGYCRTGRLNDAEQLFYTMKGRGCKPNSITYEALICAFCRVRKCKEASRLFDELLDEGLFMNVSTCNSLIDGLSRAGLVDHALKVVSYATEKKLILDPDRLVVCLRELGKVGRGAEGRGVLRDMAKKGCLKEPYASMF